MVFFNDHQKEAYMAKELKLLGPDVQEQYLYTGNDRGNREKCRYLHIPADFSQEELENDIAAGAVQYKACMNYLGGPESEMIIIICDTEEEGLNAVTYIASGTGFENTDDGEDEAEEEYIGIDYDNNIPIVGINELVSFDLGQTNRQGTGPFSMDFGMEQKKADPYWTEYEGDICVIDKCMTDEDGNIALLKHDQSVGYFPCGENGKEKWQDSFSRFADAGYRVYYILIRDTGIRNLFGEKKDQEENDFDEDPFGMYKPCFAEDFSLCSLILRYTAELVDINAKTADKEDYYALLFRNHLSDYGFTLEKRFPLRRMLRNICFMDNSPSGSMDRILKYIKHKYQDRRVLTKEIFSETGVLKNVMEKSQNDQKKNSDDVMVDDLIGMEDVKRQFENIIKSIKFCNERKRRNLPGLDYRNIFLLIGAPGTAKTTMANILGKRMKEEHLLGGTRFGSYSGAQLKGEFVGQTAPKVHQIFEEHDIIIIDEAYSLTASMHGGMDIYSQEALAQLAIELENHGKDRLVFFAGYGGSDVSEENNKMKEFLDSNPGIKSRINGTIVFPSYDVGQMIEIVKGIAGRFGFVFEDGALKPAHAYFEKRIHDSNFGNGREARSFVDNCQMSLAERIMEIPEGKRTKKMMQLITKDDVLATVERLGEADNNQYGRRTIRFGFV